MSNHRETYDPVASRIGAKLRKLGLAVGDVYPDLAVLEGAIDRLLLARANLAPQMKLETNPDPAAEQPAAPERPPSDAADRAAGDSEQQLGTARRPKNHEKTRGKKAKAAVS